MTPRLDALALAACASDLRLAADRVEDAEAFSRISRYRTQVLTTHLDAIRDAAAAFDRAARFVMVYPNGEPAARGEETTR